MIIKTIVFVIAVTLLFAAPAFFMFSFFSWREVPQSWDQKKDKSSKYFKAWKRWIILSVISFLLGVGLIIFLLQFLNGFSVIAYCFKIVATALLNCYIGIGIVVLQLSEKQKPDTTRSNFTVCYPKYIYYIGILGMIIAILIVSFLVFVDSFNEIYGWILAIFFMSISSILIYIYKRKKLTVCYGYFKSSPLAGKSKEFTLNNLDHVEIKIKHGEAFIFGFHRNQSKIFEVSYYELRNSDMLLDYFIKMTLI